MDRLLQPPGSSPWRWEAPAPSACTLQQSRPSSRPGPAASWPAGGGQHTAAAAAGRCWGRARRLGLVHPLVLTAPAQAGAHAWLLVHARWCKQGMVAGRHAAPASATARRPCSQLRPAQSSARRSAHQAAHFVEHGLVGGPALMPRLVALKDEAALAAVARLQPRGRPSTPH